jgi:predicted NUDIX family NTP pyrophosphohydrolase
MGAVNSMTQKEFANIRQQTWRAGGIPFTICPDTGEVRMLFMVPANTHYNQEVPELKMPQIAKGRIEQFELPDTAAIRECAEELGLVDGSILSTIDGGVVLGRTYIYAFEVASNAPFTSFSAETESTIWLNYDQFMEVGRELHKPVVNMLYEKIIEKVFSV